MIVIGHRQFEELRARVDQAQDPDLEPMLDALGQTAVDFAKLRITETKRTPSGKRWLKWSERYAKTRSSQHSLLRNEGNLVDSLDHQVDGKSVVVGSNLVYAATHQFGDEARKIPARTYLGGDGGFDDESEREEMRQVVRDFLGGLL